MRKLGNYLCDSAASASASARARAIPLSNICMVLFLRQIENQQENFEKSVQEKIFNLIDQY